VGPWKRKRENARAREKRVDQSIRDGIRHGGGVFTETLVLCITPPRTLFTTTKRRSHGLHEKDADSLHCCVAEHAAHGKGKQQRRADKRPESTGGKSMFSLSSVISFHMLGVDSCVF
jgi:hypothetical protein